MSENDSTKDLSALSVDEKLNLLLADMRDIKARLASLEAFAEDRSRDTRPMLERIHQEVAEQGQTLHALRRDVELFREDIFNERRARADLAARVAELERRPS